MESAPTRESSEPDANSQRRIIPGRTYSMIPCEIDPNYSRTLFCTKKKGTQSHQFVPSGDWRNIRLNCEFTQKFKTFFSVTGRTWFGVGTPNVNPIGFPGYTALGWMFCTDGSTGGYNNSVNGPAGVAIQTNEIVKFSCNPQNGRITLRATSGKKYYNCNIPPAVYFYVSIHDTSVRFYNLVVENSET